MKKVNLIDLNKDIINDVYVNYLYDFSIEVEGIFINTKVYYDNLGNFQGFVIEDNEEILIELLSRADIKDEIPITLFEYRKNPVYMDRKVSKVAFSKGTGNSSSNSYSTSLYIPAQWLHELKIDKDDNKVLMEFDGEKIVITKIKKG